jgi:hypothetical protein
MNAAAGFRYACAMRLIGRISSEGGPFLIADAVAARSWRGGDADHYERLLAALRGAGPSWGMSWPLGECPAVVWDPEGECEADVLMTSPGSLVLVRGWFDGDWDAATQEAARAPRGAQDPLGNVELRSGVLVVLWTPENGGCITDEDIARGSGQPTGGLAIEGTGLLLRLPPGRYACAADFVRIPNGQAIRCFVSPVRSAVPGSAE